MDLVDCYPVTQITDPRQPRIPGRRQFACFRAAATGLPIHHRSLHRRPRPQGPSGKIPPCPCLVQPSFQMRNRQDLHSVDQRNPPRPCMLAAPRNRGACHRHRLRVRLSQPVQFQPALPESIPLQPTGIPTPEHVNPGHRATKHLAHHETKPSGHPPRDCGVGGSGSGQYSKFKMFRNVPRCF